MQKWFFQLMISKKKENYFLIILVKMVNKNGNSFIKNTINKIENNF
jgi:hypothetical protein